MAEFERTYPNTAATNSPGSIFNRACYTAVGLARQHNEDACALPPPSVDEARLGCLLVVADGVGGMPGGAEASREAVHYLQALYYAGTGPLHPADRLSACVDLVNAINRQMRVDPDLEEGHLTTLVAAVILRNNIWVANVGDSRAYLVQAGDQQRIQLTEDHSERNRWVKSGLVTAAQADCRGTNGGITRAIGLEEHCQVDTYHYTWAPGDRLVLCSDGLSCLAAEEMSALAMEHEVDIAVQRLVEQAVEKDGTDNCTAIVAAWAPQPKLDLERAATAATNLGSQERSDATLPKPPAAITQQNQESLEDPPSEEQADFHSSDPDTQERPKNVPVMPVDDPRRWFAPPRRTLLYLFAGLLIGWLSAILLYTLLIAGV